MMGTDQGLGGRIHDRISAQAAATPQAPAVVDGTRTLSHAELAARSGEFAAALQSLGVVHGDMVLLLLPRSFDQVAALLAVLRTGAAYIPLDVTYPDERIATIQDDARPRAVITTATLARRFQRPGLGVLVVDQPLAANLPKPVDGGADDVAYVIYTSGTTGRPKGVLVLHRGLSNHASAVRSLYRLTASDRVLQFTSIAFDVAAEEILPTLAVGGCVVLRSEASTGSIADFVRFLRDERVTVANLPAPYWHELVVEMGRSRITLPESLRLVIAGSERVLPQRLAEWQKLAPAGIRWLNGYGPTETTITATAYEPAVGDDLSGCAAVPIGKPIAGVTVHVLDDSMKPTAAGESGELWIGGAGVAKGYLGQPVLTAERFVADPFTDEPGARLYRTGDLVRMRADGNLEFLGRADGQVKFRGFRIELGEIEAALARHPAVRAAAVSLREDAPGRAYLAGYVVAASTPAPSSAALRAFVKGVVPDYMVPAVVVTLDGLPLLPSGKVDRRALPQPPMGAGASGETVAPRTATETLVARHWGDLLGIAEPSVTDDFFELGGHSLLATRLVAELRDAAGVTLSVVDVFSNPTIARLAAHVDLARQGKVEGALPPLGPMPRPESIPLAFSQEPIWFLNQIEPGLLAYNTQLSVRLRGPLRMDVLRRAFDEIIRRHEILRTTFEAKQGQPFQVIHPPYRVDIPLIDLRSVPEASRHDESERLIAAEFRRTFDVTRLPLARWSVIQLGDEDFVLVQSEHHFVHDGWSIARLVGEIADLYTAFKDDKPSPLPELPVQYADYVLWQRQWMQGPALDRLLGFWTKQLGGAPPLLNLPTDRPRPKFQTFNGVSRFLDVPEDLYDRVQAFSRHEGVTPFMTMMAAFMTLLHRYTGQSDIPVGSTVANRRIRELEPVIGMIVNPIVMRANLEGDPTFGEFVRRVKTVALEAYAHQDLPFEKIVQALHPERDPAYNPIFQVMFSFHDAPVPDIDLGGTRGAIDYRYNGSAKFDWNIVVLARREQRVGRGNHDADERVTVELEYNTDLFDEATIARAMDQYLCLLAALVGDAGVRLSEAPLLPDAERRRIVTAWNPPASDFGATPLLHERIRAQAERTPRTRAVASASGALDYGQLVGRVQAIAATLRGCGVGPEVLVGVCLERSPDLVAALLGVLSAGGAYVPIDPAHPRSRLSMILDDARAPVLITQRSLVDRIPETSAKVIYLDDVPASASGPVPVKLSPDNLAYVIYTSGSTGRPKGVQIPHRALGNFMACMGRICDIGSGDTLLAVTTVSFDIAALELFLPLCGGGTTYLASREDVVDGVRLAELLAQCGATAMQATPATWRMLVESGWSGGQLKILCGGEALPASLADDLVSRGRRVLNLYGPTETTIWSAVHEVRGRGRPVVLGEPIENTALHVLDAHLVPMPLGVPGELCIGGAGLARGYLGKPAMTAERFVPDPWGAPGSTLYRTGDLVRRRADGSLEFLGRLDHQVKVRGYRIELGEIEAVLRRHEAIRDAVVLTVDRTRDDRRLAAWYVPQPGVALRSADLREFLGRTLPEYMLPSAFVEMAAFPLNTNGKVDRKALPAPSFGTGSVTDDGPVVLGPTEGALATIWKDMLGVARVTPTDNFFDLGGHSLLVFKVLSRVETEIGVRIGARDLMLQNLGQIAAIVDERKGSVSNTTPASAESREPGESGGLIGRLKRRLFRRDDGS